MKPFQKVAPGPVDHGGVTSWVIMQSITLNLHQTLNKSMSAQQQRPEQSPINEANLNALVGGILHDLGGAFSVPLVQIGESLGLYQILSENGALSPGELAAKTGLKERYLREWLSAQAASKYITFDPATEKFSMTSE